MQPDPHPESQPGGNKSEACQDAPLKRLPLKDCEQSISAGGEEMKHLEEQDISDRRSANRFEDGSSGHTEQSKTKY
jgi:hypothetical protein